MRIVCPRCKYTKSRKQYGRGSKLSCKGCGAEATYEGPTIGWTWRFPEETTRPPINEKWARPTYLEAKVDMIRMHTPPGTMFPVCIVCGQPTIAPHAHHVFRSSRFYNSHNDLRNIGPVCNESAGDCHKLAHGSKKQTARLNQTLVLGGGDLEKGQAIVDMAMAEWEELRG